VRMVIFQLLFLVFTLSSAYGIGPLSRKMSREISSLNRFCYCSNFFKGVCISNGMSSNDAMELLSDSDFKSCLIKEGNSPEKLEAIRQSLISENYLGRSENATCGAPWSSPLNQEREFLRNLSNAVRESKNSAIEIRKSWTLSQWIQAIHRRFNEGEIDSQTYQALLKALQSIFNQDEGIKKKYLDQFNEEYSKIIPVSDVFLRQEAEIRESRRKEELARQAAAARQAAEEQQRRQQAARQAAEEQQRRQQAARQAAEEQQRSWDYWQSQWKRSSDYWQQQRQEEAARRAAEEQRWRDFWQSRSYRNSDRWYQQSKEQQRQSQQQGWGQYQRQSQQQQQSQGKSQYRSGEQASQLGPKFTRQEQQEFSALLGLTVGSETRFEDIKRAYKKAVLKYHPDKTLNDSESGKKEKEQKFKQLNDLFSKYKNLNSN